MQWLAVTIAILCSIPAQGDVLGDGGDAPTACVGDEDQTCNGGVPENDADVDGDVASFVQGEVKKMLGIRVHGRPERSSSEIRAITDKVTGVLASQVEEEVRRVIVKFERLGYPREELLKRLKEKMSMMSLAEILDARWSGDTDRPECVAAKGAASAYRFGGHAEAMAGDAARADLTDKGFTFVRGFNQSGDGDWDYMGWWEKDGNCMFNFQGSDDAADFVNNRNPKPVTWMGIDGVHQGLVTELTGLVNQIDFAAVNKKCTGTFTVVGHSLGGGLAQLLTLALNREDDPLGANRRVDKIYTFGAMPVGDTNKDNDQADDGCFEGELFFTARSADDGSTQVDVVNSGKIGGGFLEPIKSTKTLLFGPGNSTTYECGNLIPPFGGAGFDLHLIQIYMFFLGCITYPEFLALLPEQH